MRRASPLLIVALAGCGSAKTLPPPAGPPQQAGDARLDTRARTLTVRGETVGAGAGPVGLATSEDRVYVTDAAQHALLVYEREPRLHLQRRTHLPGEPTDLATDAAGVVVTVEGERLAFTPGGLER